MERSTYTICETARILGLSRANTYAAARRGELPTVRLGKRFFVPRVALERWLASAGLGQTSHCGNRSHIHATPAN
jgi:excisionase family DNA binding protein